jgi:hypothetical protein
MFCNLTELEMTGEIHLASRGRLQFSSPDCKQTLTVAFGQIELVKSHAADKIYIEADKIYITVPELMRYDQLL